MAFCFIGSVRFGRLQHINKWLAARESIESFYGVSEAVRLGRVGGAFVECFIINVTDKSTVYIIVVH